jgi:three-Cys-motif partner protein
MTEYPMASDGLIARRAGEWAREKLAFLEAFSAPALSIAGSMPDRTYLDLFAGPGRNRTDDGFEFDGSPLMALAATATAKHKRGFTAAHFVNFHGRSFEALRARVDRCVAAGGSRLAAGDINQYRGDANLLLPTLMAGIPKRSYALVFADITGLVHWPWSSVEQLKAQEHSAVDLYVLFPLEMAINRFLAFERDRAEVYFPHLDSFFGCDDWRPIYDRRKTSGLGATFRAELVELYLTRLRTLWTHAIVACAPGFTADRALYRMFFATNNEPALRAARWAAEQKPDGQLGFRF